MKIQFKALLGSACIVFSIYIDNFLAAPVKQDLEELRSTISTAELDLSKAESNARYGSQLTMDISAYRTLLRMTGQDRKMLEVTVYTFSQALRYLYIPFDPNDQSKYYSEINSLEEEALKTGDASGLRAEVLKMILESADTRKKLLNEISAMKLEALNHKSYLEAAGRISSLSQLIGLLILLLKDSIVFRKKRDPRLLY